MTIALVDGDIIAFRAAAGAAQKFKFEPDDEPSVTSNPELAREAALAAVEAWRNIARCKDVLVLFTGQRNFRKTILPSYKANRVSGKPPDYWTTVEAVTDQFPTQVVNGLEADDLMGILATTDAYAGNAIILSQDKDMKTIPGRFLNPVIGQTRPTVITQDEADHWWLMQTLMGDTTDNYKGVPGCGPKKAAAILGAPGRTPVETLWPKVAHAYREAKINAEDALTQARCARILRRSDYDKTTKEILLWHPHYPVRLSLATVCGA